MDIFSFRTDCEWSVVTFSVFVWSLGNNSKYFHSFLGFIIWFYQHSSWTKMPLVFVQHQRKCWCISNKSTKRKHPSKYKTAEFFHWVLCALFCDFTRVFVGARFYFFLTRWKTIMTRFVLHSPIIRLNCLFVIQLSFHYHVCLLLCMPTAFRVTFSLTPYSLSLALSSSILFILCWVFIYFYLRITHSLLQTINTDSTHCLMLKMVFVPPRLFRKPFWPITAKAQWHWFY